MDNYVFLFLFSGAATLFFALSVRSTLKNAFIAGGLGGLGYVLYVSLGTLLSDSGAVFFATLAACLGAEVVARLIKSPATVFSIPAIIPLVPGIMLYQTMLKFGEGNNAAGTNSAVATILVAGSMSLAVTIATLVAKQMFRKKR